MFNTDLHIHSCLSPCADGNMTPRELVRAAKRAGLDLIALTDHNSCGNCAEAAAEAQALGLGFIPGIEVTTLEEIHCICLLPDLGKAAAFARWLDTLCPVLPSRTNPINRTPAAAAAQRRQEERQRLYLARRISVADLLDAARKFRGLCWPAHLQKPYNSLYAVLGAWPADLRADAAELFGEERRPADIPADVKTLCVSDAHHLWDFQPGGYPLPLVSPDFAGLRRYLLGE